MLRSKGLYSILLYLGLAVASMVWLLVDNFLNGAILIVEEALYLQ